MRSYAVSVGFRAEILDFENSRYADYRKLKEEESRESPVFGSRYLFGNGATYYVNLFVRF